MRHLRIKSQTIASVLVLLFLLQVSQNTFAQEFSSSKLLPECIDRLIDKHQQVFLQEDLVPEISEEEHASISKSYLLAFWNISQETIYGIESKDVFIGLGLLVMLYDIYVLSSLSNKMVQQNVVNNYRTRIQHKLYILQKEKFKVYEKTGGMTSPKFQRLKKVEAHLEGLLKNAGKNALRKKMVSGAIVTLSYVLLVELYNYFNGEDVESNIDIETTTSALENAATHEELLQYIYTKDENSQVVVSKAYDLCLKAFKMSDEDILNLNFDPYFME